MIPSRVNKERRQETSRSPAIKRRDVDDWPRPVAARELLGPSGLTPAAVVALQQTLGNRATGQVIARSSRIQRKIQWMDGARTHDMDLTEPLTAFADFGVTPTRINVEEFPGGDATKAISPPEIQVEKALLGMSRAKVFKAPVQFVGYRMRLPKPPPSQQTVATDMVLSALRGHAPSSAEAQLEQYGKNVKGQTTLVARGLPSDAEFARLVEEHEDHHVEEIKDAVRRILAPWDRKIDGYERDGETFTRPGAESAKQALLSAAGGTASEIGQRLVDDLKASGTAFHHTTEGSSPTIGRIDVDEANSTLTIYWKHPLSK